MIPEEKVAEVRERAGIVEVIGDYISLRRSGANFQGLCPFHGEKTPSFNVNPARGIFHCFGCGVGGNVVTFVMKMEGLSFPESVKLLAKRVGVVIEERPLSGAEQKRQDEREQALRITALAAAYYCRMLRNEPAGEAGRRYLAKRGVPAEIMEPYRLGFASERWDGLVAHLEQQRVPLELAERLGLIRKRQGGNGYYDLFRNRLIFTIANVYGGPIAFGGRVLDDSLPKYINSPESLVYRKSDVLFGIDLAKPAMRETGKVIIVEGYFDHLALYRAGVRHALATCGTALTAGHIQLLKRYAEKIYLLFDADSAGKKATFRAMELLLDEQVEAFVIELPAGDDPDSFLGREGSTAFAERVDKARPVLEYFLRDLLDRSQVGTVTGTAAAVDELVPLLKKVQDPVRQDLYVREVARLLAVDQRTILQRLGRSGGGQPRPAGRQGERRNSAGPAETLLVLVGRFPEVAELAREFGLSRLFPAGLLPLAERLTTEAVLGHEPDWAALLELVAETEVRQQLAALVVDDAHLTGIEPQRAFADLCRTIEMQQLKHQDVKALRQELARLDTESPRYWEILRLLDTLRNQKSQLL
ncbi:MAG TPA: DNA primase [Geobacteraceae bacterium]